MIDEGTRGMIIIGYGPQIEKTEPKGRKKIVFFCSLVVFLSHGFTAHKIWLSKNTKK